MTMKENAQDVGLSLMNDLQRSVPTVVNHLNRQTLMIITMRKDVIDFLDKWVEHFRLMETEDGFISNALEMRDKISNLTNKNYVNK